MKILTITFLLATLLSTDVFANYNQQTPVPSAVATNSLQGNLSNATGTTLLPSAGYPSANYYNHNGSWSYPAPWEPGAGGFYNY